MRRLQVTVSAARAAASSSLRELEEFLPSDDVELPVLLAAVTVTERVYFVDLGEALSSVRTILIGYAPSLTSFSVGVKVKVGNENVVKGTALPTFTIVLISSLSGSLAAGRL